MTSFKPAQVFSRTPSTTSNNVIPAGKSRFKSDTISHKSLYRPKTDNGEGEWLRLSSTSSLSVSSPPPRTKRAYDKRTTLSTTSIHPLEASKRASSSCNPSKRSNIVPSPPSSELRSTINLDNLSTSSNLLLDNPCVEVKRVWISVWVISRSLGNSTLVTSNYSLASVLV
jgi:hypothetical protein